MFEVTYEVVKDGKKTIFTRKFYSEDMAKSEVTFVKNAQQGISSVTAISYKKVK